MEMDEPRNEIASGGCVPPDTVIVPDGAPCERMLIVPVPGGTLNVTLLPTFCCPGAGVMNSSDEVGCTARWQLVGCVAGAFGETPRGIGVGAVPLGVHEGDAFGDRHSPLEQVSAPLMPEQSPLQDAKQNAPVEVLTQVLPDGHVVRSAGLQAAVHAPPGNSGFGFEAPTQISPAPVHCALPVHAFASVTLAGRFCAGQFAAGTHARNPAQQT